MFAKIKNKIKEHRLLIHNTPSEYDKSVISWIAPEMIRHDRGTVWKIVVSLISATIIAGGIVYNSWTFSLAVAAFIVVYYLVNLEHPKDIEVKLSEIGIKVGTKKYPFSRIKAFWIIYEHPYVKTLNIRIAGEILADITIQLNHQNSSEVRNFLIAHIPELEGQSEKITDIFLRLFKI
ncbi:hypothetical protein A3B60_00115 [Candidatus Peregrinibacteria bacterium RIFCSPLOWO2_01_FULL_39_12]|nr:MAG: hypothetical protein A3B60_00115 [Candidatus Peregrinibacteria bacterium RIFCSPLOWO2_01_FULL_39_12]